ncbi:MAG: GNAT family N-acetyltransferase [Planctomycetes bacterium]|nr:GNAT family N-acetyltransferase [Planctomycetota bacterium]
MESTPTHPAPSPAGQRPASGVRVRGFDAADGVIVDRWLRRGGFSEVARVPRRAWVGRLLRDERLIGRIAESGGLPRGFVRLEIGPDRSAEVTVVVDPAARRAGIGTELLWDARSQALARGCVRLVAWIEPGNRAARELFLSAGFELRDGESRRFECYERLIHGAERQPPIEIVP